MMQTTNQNVTTNQNSTNRKSTSSICKYMAFVLAVDSKCSRSGIDWKNQ